ncbi:hypothetical protein OE810_08365 [Rhodobacteraceae bacterium XHP0102]|nr:hypothetical protein [Rhodobacteraceae bacterium XHP0102]
MLRPKPPGRWPCVAGRVETEVELWDRTSGGDGTFMVVQITQLAKRIRLSNFPQRGCHRFCSNAM